MESSNKIVEIINALCEKLGLAIDWTGENVLPYIEELIGRFVQFEIVTSIFWICFVLVMAICAFFIARFFTKKADEEDEDEWEEDNVAAWFAISFWIVFGGLVIASLIVIPIQAMDIIECSTLPEKAIIDYLTSNMK